MSQSFSDATQTIAHCRFAQSQQFATLPHCLAPSVFSPAACFRNSAWVLLGSPLLLIPAVLRLNLLTAKILTPLDWLCRDYPQAPHVQIRPILLILHKLLRSQVPLQQTLRLTRSAFSLRCLNFFPDWYNQLTAHSVSLWLKLAAAQHWWAPRKLAPNTMLLALTLTAKDSRQNFLSV